MKPMTRSSKVTFVALSLAFVLVGGGCGDERASSHAENPSDTQRGEAEGVEFGGDEAPPEVDIIGLPNADANSPCGDDTVSVVKHESGANVIFCVHEGGVASVGEYAAKAGEEATLLRTLHYEAGMSPAELFQRVAPGSPVPERLLSSAAPPEGPNRVLVVDNTPKVPDGATIRRLNHTWNHYCGPNGASNFYWDHCDDLINEVCVDPSYNCEAVWCIDQPFWGWHDRSMSSTLGEEADHGLEYVAACKGLVRFRVLFRWDIGDAWQTKVDLIINNGGLVHWHLDCIAASEDCDVRFRADSADGLGVHRHGGYFADF